MVEPAGASVAREISSSDIAVAQYIAATAASFLAGLHGRTAPIEARIMA